MALSHQRATIIFKTKNMNEIAISKTIMNKAISHSKERLKYEYDRFKLPTAQRKSMILIGTIGQLIFKEYLEKKNIVFEFEYQAGKYDCMDFSINKEIIEIKTSGYGMRGFNNLNLLYSDDQFQAGIAKGFKYCVQIFINGYKRKDKLIIPVNCNLATIAGFILFKDIKKYPNQRIFYGDDYKVPIDNLTPIDQLLNDTIL